MRRSAVADDVTDLEREGRVVRHDRGVGRRDEVRVAVFVLQPLAVQGGASCCCTDQEAAGHLVAGAQSESAVRWNPNIE